jgi:hypothetical protein
MTRETMVFTAIDCCIISRNNVLNDHSNLPLEGQTSQKRHAGLTRGRGIVRIRELGQLHETFIFKFYLISLSTGLLLCVIFSRTYMSFKLFHAETQQ